MTKLLIPAALALGVFAVTGTTSLVSPVHTAEAAANCNHIIDAAQRTSCETRERRRETFERQFNFVGGNEFGLRADPGGAGGGGGQR